MYKIYIVRNTVNGKIYVGQTKKSVKTRWKQHIQASKHHQKTKIIFMRAIKKYGPSAFTIREIDSTDDPRMANGLEMAYILLYQATNPELGYNGTFGGDGGQIPTQATRDKISATRKLRGLKCAWMGSPNEAAIRAKISIGKKGDKNPNYGKLALNRIELPAYIVVPMYQSGASVEIIANVFKCSDTVVLRTLRDNHVEIKLSACHRNLPGKLSWGFGRQRSAEELAKLRASSIATRRPDVKDEELVRLYQDDGYSAVALAKRFSISSTSIYHRLKYLGIPRRSIGRRSPKYYGN